LEQSRWQTADAHLRNFHWTDEMTAAECRGSGTGLAWFSLYVATPEILEQQEQRLRQNRASVDEIKGGIETADPWGTKLHILHTA
jgi:catechol-2,3-dioxygenase